MALGQGSLGVAVQPLSSETTAPLQSTETGQLHSAPLWSSKRASVVQLQLGRYSLQWKGKVHSLIQRGADYYTKKSPSLVLDWSILMQMRTPNPHSLIGPKSTVLISQNGTALVSLVNGDANEDIAPQFQLDGESFSPIG